MDMIDSKARPIETYLLLHMLPSETERPNRLIERDLSGCYATSAATIYDLNCPIKKENLGTTSRNHSHYCQKVEGNRLIATSAHAQKCWW